MFSYHIWNSHNNERETSKNKSPQQVSSSVLNQKKKELLLFKVLKLQVL